MANLFTGLTAAAPWGMVWGVMIRLKQYGLLLAAAAGLCSPVSQAVEVILTGGVALKTWEHLRGPAKHDNWWANFVRASTVRMELARRENPSVRFVWIVYRPAYITRGKEDRKDYVSMIRDLSKKYNAQLVFADTADQVYAAINNAPRGNDRIHSFYYFGHSNAHAFMLDYSNSIIGSSKQWIHEDDLTKRIKRNIFTPDAQCFSFGCYTGKSMTAKWKSAFGVTLVGNTESTRYQPVGDGKMPVGAGAWVK